MNYVAMATARFDEVIRFYTNLGFKKVRGWDRPNGRGQVLELGGLDDTRGHLPIETPEPVDTSWGARLLKLRDPDGIRVWFMQWLTEPNFQD
jgi:catechol 2,3-dioxygenase-like lactoylglutathione lyase family enzyme